MTPFRKGISLFSQLFQHRFCWPGDLENLGGDESKKTPCNTIRTFASQCKYWQGMASTGSYPSLVLAFYLVFFTNHTSQLIGKYLI